MVVSTLRTLVHKAHRDRELSLRLRLAKGVRYITELAAARIWLSGVNSVGAHARTFGRPRIQNLGRMELGSHVLLRSVNVPVELCTGPAGVLRIGDGARINYGTSVAAENLVTIGKRARIGPYVMIVDTDFHDPYRRSRRPAGVPVVIEDDVWIGAKASVLKGVRIGRGAIVGVGAVVTRDVAPFTVVAGVPARAVAALDVERFEQEDVA